MGLPQVAQRLNDGAALPASGGDVPGSRSLQDDFAIAQFDMARRAVGKEDDWTLSVKPTAGMVPGMDLVIEQAERAPED